MRIVSVNVNGIRAAARKGFFDWMDRQDADVVCIQETKAQVAQLEDAVFWPRGWHAYYHDAEKKGYSGVALYSRRKPDKVIMGLGWPDMDAEGRYIEARFGALSVVSVYLPSGSSSEEILRPTIPAHPHLTLKKARPMLRPRLSRAPDRSSWLRELSIFARDPASTIRSSAR